MHLFFMFDEHSDKSSPEDVLGQAHALTAHLYNPDMPQSNSEWVGAEIMRQ